MPSRSSNESFPQVPEPSIAASLVPEPNLVASGPKIARNPSAKSAKGAAPAGVTLNLRLKGGKVCVCRILGSTLPHMQPYPYPPTPQMVNRVRVCTSSWTVLGLDQPLCGDTESWEMRGWRSGQQQG